MTAIFQKGRPERFIIFVLLLTRPALFLMSLNHISRPHKCPLPTDGGTLVMTAHCSITIWSNFSVNSKWFSPNPHIIHNHIITICKQCNVCAKKCLDRKVAYILVKQVWTQNIFIGHGTGPTWSVFEQSEKVLHPQGWFFFSDTHCTPCLLLDLPRHIIHVCLLSEKQLLLRENICVPDIALLCNTFLSCQILKHNSNCSQALCFYLIFRCARISWFEVVIWSVSQCKVSDWCSLFRFQIFRWSSNTGDTSNT